MNELIQLKNYTSQRNDKLLIPIVAGEINFENFPESIISINFITLQNKLSENEINEVVKKINEAINSFLGKKLATDEQAQEIKEKIETTVLRVSRFLPENENTKAIHRLYQQLYNPLTHQLLQSYL